MYLPSQCYIKLFVKITALILDHGIIWRFVHLDYYLSFKNEREKSLSWDVKAKKDAASQMQENEEYIVLLKVPLDLYLRRLANKISLLSAYIAANLENGIPTYRRRRNVCLRDRILFNWTDRKLYQNCYTRAGMVLSSSTHSSQSRSAGTQDTYHLSIDSRHTPSKNGPTNGKSNDVHHIRFDPQVGVSFNDGSSRNSAKTESEYQQLLK
ncbi:hypothetical protein RF11_14357 [Thelohanellus kitauei]|uniref:Uncharacterized protein n=1 Tax=Thelohanellus kitauei TaxID=669202 RepID=A0A0C2IFW1_THEKT|nr:hypothetical protein RF11_14357 [Thelohanellus kitauei]